MLDMSALSGQELQANRAVGVWPYQVAYPPANRRPAICLRASLVAPGQSVKHAIPRRATAFKVVSGSRTFPAIKGGAKNLV